VRVLLEELLDRIGHEFRELPLELLEQGQPLARLLKVLERGLELLVLRGQLRVGLGEPRGHVVERAAQLPDLIAGSRQGPCLEVAVADAPGDRLERPDGRTTTELIATVRTLAAARIVNAAISIWRFRRRRTSPKTGSIEVATRTTARTL